MRASEEAARHVEEQRRTGTAKRPDDRTPSESEGGNGSRNAAADSAPETARQSRPYSPRQQKRAPQPAQGQSQSSPSDASSDPADTGVESLSVFSDETIREEDQRRVAHAREKSREQEPQEQRFRQGGRQEIPDAGMREEGTRSEDSGASPGAARKAQEHPADGAAFSGTPEGGSDGRPPSGTSPARFSRSVAGTSDGNQYYAEVDTSTVGPRMVWRLVVAVLVIIALVCGAWLWANRLRTISVKVDGQAVRVRVNTSIASFVDHHGYFGKPSGNLLAVDGSVIRKNAGSKPQVLYNGNPLSVRQYPSTRLADGDRLSIVPGGDITERHRIKRIPIKPGFSFKPGGTIQFVRTQGKDGYSQQAIGLVSHKTVNLGVVRKPVDTAVDSLSPNPSGDKKYVALTFDDGPSPKYTPQYLKILKDNNVHATFFNIGSQAKTCASLDRQLVKEGHELASHTWDHPDLVRLVAKDRNQALSEVRNAENQVAENVGAKAPNAMMRMPYGSYSSSVWKAIHTVTSSAVLWDIDTRDWAFPGADAIVSNVMTHVHNGAIILMHDGGGTRDQDVQALPQIISQLKSQGYTFVTVSELMRLDGRFPKAVVEQRVMK